MSRRALLLIGFLLPACATPPPPPPPAPVVPPPPPPLPHDIELPTEPHLQHLRALTRNGENAEAYWAWSGSELIMQARPPDATCDRIFRLPLSPPSGPTPIPVSDGRGATTCSYFLPGDREVIFASTEGGGP